MPKDQSAEAQAQRFLIVGILDCFDERELNSIRNILIELRKAKKKFPKWPIDPIHAAAIVAEESGELVRASLHEAYEPNLATPRAMVIEAIQTGAMAIRFVSNSEKYLRGKEAPHV